MQSAHFNKKDDMNNSTVEGISTDEVKRNDEINHNLPIAENIGLFDPEKLSNAIDHANQITLSYGVTVMSINIISAVPKDMDLMRSLAKGAVAAAEAQQMVEQAVAAIAALLIKMTIDAFAAACASASSCWLSWIL